MDPQHLALLLITFGAAIVNGALGYGFSSLTVPIEVALNAYVLWVNRESLGLVWRRVLPIVIGLIPGVVAGTSLVSQVHPGWLKFGTFITLLPLIFLQAAGYRRPLKSERSV